MNVYFRRHKGLLIKWMSFELCYAISMVLWSYFMKNLSDVLHNEGLGSIEMLFLYGVFFIVFYFFAQYCAEIYKAKFINKCNVSLKQDLYKAIINKNINVFNEDNSAKYISILNNDVGLIEQKYFALIPDVIATCMLAVIAGLTMIFYNVMLGIITLVINLLPLLQSYFIGDVLSKKRKMHIDSLEKFNSSIKDIFNGFEIIKIFNAENKVGEKYNEVSCEVEDKVLSLRKSEALIHAFMYTTNYLTVVLQLVLSVYLIYKNYITMGILLGMMQISNYVSNPIHQVTEKLVEYRSIGKVINRIVDVLNDTNQDDTLTKKVNIDNINSICLKNVSFGYKAEANTIKDISFEFEAYKKYAIVGRSGCGKSTLAKLIMDYYDDYKGSILLNNQELQNINKESLYKNISLINQNIMLFDDNIKNNVTMFKEYDDDKVEQVISLAGLKNLVDISDKGIYSAVNENGKNFSGGEKQRIALARAFIRNTPILILDEATSSLDNETAYNIENLVLKMKDLTCIVVTHKLNASILKHYDEIIVMSDGKIVEHDNFDNLINKKGYFYSLYKYGI